MSRKTGQKRRQRLKARVMAAQTDSEAVAIVTEWYERSLLEALAKGLYGKKPAP